MASERGYVEERNREFLEELIAEPQRFPWVRVSNEDIGEPGCRHWHSRPRWGLIGMLMGWWRVKLSSGCPLAASSPGRPARLALAKKRKRRRRSAPRSAAWRRRGHIGRTTRPSARRDLRAAHRRAAGGAVGLVSARRAGHLHRPGPARRGFIAGGSEGTILIVTGLLFASLGGLELSVREHFSGYRSHTTLLAGLAAVACLATLLRRAISALAVHTHRCRAPGVRACGVGSHGGLPARLGRARVSDPGLQGLAAGFVGLQPQAPCHGRPTGGEPTARGRRPRIRPPSLGRRPFARSSRRRAISPRWRSVSLPSSRFSLTASGLRNLASPCPAPALLAAEQLAHRHRRDLVRALTDDLGGALASRLDRPLDGRAGKPDLVGVCESLHVLRRRVRRRSASVGNGRRGNRRGSFHRSSSSEVARSLPRGIHPSHPGAEVGGPRQATAVSFLPAPGASGLRSNQRSRAAYQPLRRNPPPGRSLRACFLCPTSLVQYRTS